jgi:hypothetical protein
LSPIFSAVSVRDFSLPTDGVVGEPGIAVLILTSLTHVQQNVVTQRHTQGQHDFRANALQDQSGPKHGAVLGHFLADKAPARHRFHSELDLRRGETFHGRRQRQALQGGRDGLSYTVGKH